MPRTISEPQIKRNESSYFTGKCEKNLDGKAVCPLDDEKKFPAINDIHSKTLKKDPGKSSTKVVSLPKLNMDSISEQRIDAGEPYGSNNTISSADIETFREACDHLKQFQMLGASSSEEQQRSLLLTDYKSLSKSSTRSKTFENFLEVQESNEKTEESHALKRWEYWLEEKKKIQNYLSKRLGRPVDDLLMQEPDKFREVMEKKMMRWYSRIPDPDKGTRSPIRWIPQLRIRNKKIQAPYCLIKSKMEKEKRPEMEFIGIPNPIKKEKGLLCDNGKDSKTKVKPDTTRKVHCKKESSCDSHEIEMDELAVVGVKIGDRTTNNHHLFTPENMPKIIVEELMEEEQSSQCMERTTVFSLVIGDEEIKYEIGSENRQDPDRMFVWNIDFGVNVIGSTIEKVLRVENRGTITVGYDWLPSNFDKKRCFGGLLPRRYEPWFFFNKNSGYFLPGQIYYLKFYFQGKTSGIRKEVWYLRTDPHLPGKAQFATFVLSGVTTEEYSTEGRTLELYLERRVVESCIRSIIEEILYKALDPYNGLLDIEYRCFFTEKQLFEYQNSKHFYHSSVVKELKKIFEEIPDKNQTEWDLSLTSLYHLMKIHETGEKKSASFRELAEMSFKLYRPNYLPVKDGEMYIMSYAVLCRMINFIEEDYTCLRNIVSEKMEEPVRLRGLGEAGESTVSIETAPEEMGEIDSNPMLWIRPINFMFFRTLVYLKTYRRICDATEQIAGIVETRKKFKPWKTVNYKPPKPPKPRVGKSPAILGNKKFFRPEQHKVQVKILSPK